jgi:hypothetical protein
VGIVTGPHAAHAGVLNVTEFLSQARGLWATASVTLLALSGGVFTVPCV